MKKAPDDYDGHDTVFNGKVDVVVDLRRPGSPGAFVRNEGAGSKGDFIEGTVGIRTRNGLIVICAMDLEDQECFDISYRTGDPDETTVRAKDGYTSMDIDANQSDITALGFVNGTRVALGDATDDGNFETTGNKVKATGSQAVKLIAVVVDK